MALTPESRDPELINPDPQPRMDAPRRERTKPNKAADYEGMLNRIFSRIRNSLELNEILAVTVQEIQAFLNIDRVKIYRFEPSGSGEVVAEAIKGKALPSLLGLHFPASDLPPQARQLFIQARQRVIVDVKAGKRITSDFSLENPEQPPDIRFAPLDTCHEQYLSNMGVNASLVLPICLGAELWGLVACHHRHSRIFTERELQIVQLLVDQVVVAITQANLLHQARTVAQQESTLSLISQLLHAPLPQKAMLENVLEAAVKVLAGCGGRLFLRLKSNIPELYITGLQPPSLALEQTPVWQAAMGLDQGKSQPLEPSALIPLTALQSQELSRPIVMDQLPDTPDFQALKPHFFATCIRALVIVPLRYQEQCVGCLTIFRPSITTEVRWAGRVDQDSRNDCPRDSFQAWHEINGDLAHPWQATDLKLAQSIGMHLYLALMKQYVEDVIRHQAHHDALTGLPNRHLLNDRLSLALAELRQTAELLGLVFMDLDYFKVINDSLGHGAGDLLLQSVAQRLQGCLRRTDIVARWGGDEFVILLPHLDAQADAIQIMEKILRAFETPFDVQAQELHITPSIGLALAPYDGEDSETLLKNADAALYRAKQQGRNTFALHTQDSQDETQRRLALANALYRAIHSQNLALFYQPQIDLKTGEIMGLEALSRWYDPEFGMIPPSVFIPLAEEIGLISQVGEWVLKEACQQGQQWQQQGFRPVRIAINISARQLQKNNLTEMIVQTLAATGFPAEYLEVEITESIAIQNLDLSLAVLQELRGMGVKIALDDFGTGYSSLVTLQHLPLDYLKIDRGFLQNLTPNSKNAALVRAIIALGHGMQLKIIAEGVENQSQLNLLKELGCDIVQGYLLSHPLAPEHLATGFLDPGMMRGLV